MSLKVGELVGYLSVDDSNWKSGIAGAQGDLSRLGDDGSKKASRSGAMIGSALSMGAIYGLGKLKKFTFGAVDTFAALQDAVGATGGIFGEAGPGIIDFAEKAAKTFGLSKRAALESLNNLAMMGKAAGLETGKLAGFSQELTGLAGDMASYYGGTAESAAMAVSSALRGQMEPIRAYNVLLDDQTLRIKAVEMGLISSVKEGLTPANKVLAAQAAIIEKTTYLQGDYAKYAYYTANVQKTLASETENAQAMMGEKLAPAVTAVRQAMLWLILRMSTLIDVITIVVNKVRILTDFLWDNRKPILIIAGLITALFLPALIRLGVESVIAAAKAVASWLVMQAQAIASTAVSAVQFAIQGAKWVWMGITALASAAQVALAWIIAMGPIILVTAAVIGLVVLIVANWEKIKEVTVRIWNAVFGTISDVVSKVINWVKANWPLLLAILAGPIGLAVLAIAKHWDKITSGVTHMKDRVVDTFKTVISFIAGIPGKILEALGDLGNLLWQAGKDLMGGFLKGITGAAGSVIGGVAGVAKGMLGKVTGIFGIGSPSKVFAEIGRNVVRGMVIGMESQRSGLGASMSNVMRIPTVPQITGVGESAPASMGGFNRAASNGGLSIGSMTVVGYDPDEAVRKFGQELQWQMAGGR